MIVSIVFVLLFSIIYFSEAPISAIELSRGQSIDYGTYKTWLLMAGCHLHLISNISIVNNGKKEGILSDKWKKKEIFHYILVNQF